MSKLFNSRKKPKSRLCVPWNLDIWLALLFIPSKHGTEIQSEQMAHHIAFLKALVKRPFEELVNLHKTARKENDDSFIIDLRKDLIALEGRATHLEVVRCFVRTTDSHGLEDTGWVINESCRVCLRCGMAFGLLLWRHHCRICGLLVCNPCSLRSNPILDAPGLEHSRVCRECWQCEVRTSFLFLRS